LNRWITAQIANGEGDASPRNPKTKKEASRSPKTIALNEEAAAYGMDATNPKTLEAAAPILLPWCPLAQNDEKRYPSTMPQTTP
jgi:hypothetical protein